MPKPRQKAAYQEAPTAPNGLRVETPSKAGDTVIAASQGSPPSTVAESLRSFWTWRRGNRRGLETYELLRQLQRQQRNTRNTTMVRSSPQVNTSIQRLFTCIQREFIESWYSKISDDNEFTDEVQQTLSSVTHELERRCRRVDWVQFALFEVPEIVHLHVRDAHQCIARQGTAYTAMHSLLEASFQAMHPHVALSSAAESELRYLRSMAHELLKTLLPPEAQTDEATCHLLREIIGCTVLRNAVATISDPSTLNHAIVKVLGRYSASKYFSEADMDRYFTYPEPIDESQAIGRSPQPPKSVEGQLQEAQATDIVENPESTPTHTLQGPGGDTTQENLEKTEAGPPAVGRSKTESSISTTGRELSNQLSFGSRWLIRDLVSPSNWMGWKNNAVRGLIYLHLILAQALSRVVTMVSEYTFSLNQLWQADAPLSEYRGASEPLLALMNALLWLDRYNYWMWAQFLLYIFPLVNILAGPAIDRTLVKIVCFLISERQIALYINTLVDNLWSDGERLSEPRPYRTLDQQKMLKRDAELLVAELIPYVVARFFYGISPDARHEAAARILEPFENHQMNKHLVYTLLDSVVSKITPELL